MGGRVVLGELLSWSTTFWNYYNNFVHIEHKKLMTQYFLSTKWLCQQRPGKLPHVLRKPTPTVDDIRLNWTKALLMGHPHTRSFFHLSSFFEALFPAHNVLFVLVLFCLHTPGLRGFLSIFFESGQSFGKWPLEATWTGRFGFLKILSILVPF